MAEPVLSTSWRILGRHGGADKDVGRHQRWTSLRRTGSRLAPHLRHRTRNANVSVHTLMKLMGHESLVTSQRYVDGAGTETRSAAENNPLYGLLSYKKPPRW